MPNKPLSIIPAAALIAAAPGHADITATYVNNEGRPSQTIEIDGQGNIRVGRDESGYYLATSAGEFLVEPGPGGPVVTSVTAAVRLAAPRLKNRQVWRPTHHYRPVGPGRVGAWEGVAYKAEVETAPPRPLTAVISEDPRLAPLGAALLQAAQAQFIAARRPDAEAEFAELLSRGALLSDSYRTLGSVSFDQIPPERFALPAEPITLADVAGAPLEEEPFDDSEPQIIQAVFFDGELWTLDDRGGLGRTPEGGSQRIPAEAPGYADSICRGPSALWLATQRELGEPVRLWLRSGNAGWEARGEVPVSRDAWLVGTECAGERPRLLFTDKLVAGDKVIPLKLEQVPRRLVAVPRRGGRATGLIARDGALYVSIDNGEWGGGIQRIPLEGRTTSSAEAETICVRERTVCSGVSGMAADPARQGCLLASVASIGLGPSGKVVRICGTTVEQVYTKPYTMNPEWEREQDPSPRNSVAFWTMAGGNDAAWALGDDGIYRFGAGRDPELRPFPPVQLNRIDWSQPGVIVVPTLMERRHPFSASFFLLAPR